MIACVFLRLSKSLQKPAELTQFNDKAKHESQRDQCSIYVKEE